MGFTSEKDIFDLAYQFYQKGFFQQAYDLLTESFPNLPSESNRFYQWRICIAAQMGDLVLAEKLLQQALDEGNYFSEFLLRSDPDLEKLQGRDVFESLIKKSLEKFDKEQENAKPALSLLEPTENDISIVRLIIALHGNYSNETQTKGYWNFLTNLGWLVALPISSQIQGNNVSTWQDQSIAEKELVMHHSEIQKKYALKPDTTILSGFSLGGYAAMVAALKQIFPVRGFISVAPSIKDTKEFDQLLKNVRTTNLRGYFLLGEEDDRINPTVIEWINKLNKKGIACDKEIFPGIGHNFPKEYQPAIERAISFIFRG